MLNIIPPVYAASPTPLPTPIGELCGPGLGPFAEFLCTLQSGDQQTTTNNAVSAVAAFAFLLSNIIGIFAAVAGIIFIFQFLIGGYNWLTSSGDKERVSKAQQTLLHAVIGLAVVLAAYALISLVGAILGFDILISDPGKFVERIRPR